MPLDSMLHATQLNMHARPNGPACYYVTHAHLSRWHTRPWHASAHLACSCHGNFPVPQVLALAVVAYLDGGLEMGIQVGRKNHV